MNEKDINYATVVSNLKNMIYVLEFDSMRSQGKAKLNSQHLQSMYFLVDRYEANIAKKTEIVNVKKEN